MKYEVNECCDCATDAYPCIGDECSQLHKTYYQCDMCNEPVDAQDDFCRGCGRRLTDG